MNNDITYKIRPAGRHLLTIGRDLIQDNYAAVIELVKNAYDADSPDVSIEFRKSPDRSGYSIVISDHGHGMSRDDVINKWLVPSTQDKIKRQNSPSGRPLQGSKGVGRYAASVLGKDMFLETVTRSGEKTMIFLEWKDFEEAQYLDDVNILVETTQTSEPQGTRLIMNGNNQHLVRWNKDRFDKLRFELKKLTSPIIRTLSHEASSDVFRISLRVEGFPNVSDIKETVEPYPLLELFDYRIVGYISTEGKGMLTYSSQKARNIVDQKIPFDFGNPTDCGELDIDIRVYDREPKSIDSLIKRGFKDEFGNYVEKNQARQILNANNGIAVYRNGFRIRPLGDAEFDWLKLNARRIQTPTRCIGSNQVIGYVQIQSEHQSGLIEKSARDGLLENQAFEQLKAVTEEVLAELEILRYIYRKKEGLSRHSIKVDRDLQGLFSSDTLKQNIQTQLTKGEVDRTTADEIIELIKQDAEEKNKVVEEIREVVAIYQAQAVLGKIVRVILHEGSKPIAYFNNQIDNLKYWCKSFQKTKDPLKLEKIETIANGILQNAEVFVKLFRRLDPLAAGKRGRKKLLEMKKTIEGTLSVFENEMKLCNVFANVNGPDHFKFSAWEQDIYAIFTNLVDNSLYWISEKESLRRKISIDIKIEGSTLVYIDYRDTGPGIDVAHIDNEVIFEPDFTTKPGGGSGLGLAIAGEAADRNDLELLAFESNDGAHFRLQPKMENENEDDENSAN